MLKFKFIPVQAKEEPKVQGSEVWAELEVITSMPKEEYSFIMGNVLNKRRKAFEDKNEIESLEMDQTVSNSQSILPCFENKKNTLAETMDLEDEQEIILFAVSKP